MAGYHFWENIYNVHRFFLFDNILLKNAFLYRFSFERFLCTVLILGDDVTICFISRLIASHVLHLRLLAREEGNYAQLIRQMSWRYCIMLVPNVGMLLDLFNLN